jgi:phage N-6-adenine-methyltransferase
MNPALNSSDRTTWQTPPEFLARVRKIAPIGLDPATAPDNPTGASTFFTEKENGLALPWTLNGLVFLNPPYGRAIPTWMDKARREAKRGAEIVALIPSRTDTRWFHDSVFWSADCVLFWKGRFRFIDADTGKPGDAAPFPSAIPYWGPRPLAFARAFEDCGKLVSLRGPLVQL